MPTPIIPTYSERLSTALAALGVAVEAVSTGGGCYALATVDHRFLITNGDCALPDGETDSGWETIAVVCDYDEGGESGEEIATLEVCEISRAVLQSIERDESEPRESRESVALAVDTVPTVADTVARWVAARR